MNASRMKPETHWKNVGAAVAKQSGSLADLDRVLTGKKEIDGWIREGYDAMSRKETARAIKLALRPPGDTA